MTALCQYFSFANLGEKQPNHLRLCVSLFAALFVRTLQGAGAEEELLVEASLSSTGL
jgi:hypothetical protein